MLDRYDARDDDGRSRGDSFDRDRGSRGSSDRDDNSRNAFGRHTYSTLLVDKFDRGLASVEGIVLSRQYLHLAHLVGVA